MTCRWVKVFQLRGSWVVVSKKWLFSPLFGEMIQFDDHIFQRGWNHQLDRVFDDVFRNLLEKASVSTTRVDDWWSFFSPSNWKLGAMFDWDFYLRSLFVHLFFPEVMGIPCEASVTFTSGILEKQGSLHPHEPSLHAECWNEAEIW